MSHFTVSLIIPGIENIDQLKGRIEKMLIPYMESGAGDVPREYLVFQDMEDEYLQEYETKSTEKVRMEDGTLVWPWDKRFEVGADIFTRKLVVPDHLVKLEVPYNQLYATFEEYCKQYHGSNRDPENKRHGYWHNPQGYWDWYAVGGRWSGLLRTKDGFKDDFAQFKDLDLEWAVRQEQEDRQTFIKQLHAFYTAGMKEDDRMNPFDGVRSVLLKLGILDCVNLDEIAALEEKCGPIPEKRRLRWDYPHYKGPERYDVLMVDPELVDEAWLENHDGGYFHPFHTYAMVDEHGWHQPGKMGWWASSSATPESRESFGTFFRDRFKRAVEETPDAFLVVVDCHV
jgi:hypothetical protein